MTIKEIRALTGLSQKKFAEKYELNYRTLQNWEGGTNRPPKGFEKLLLRAVIDDQEKEAQSEGQLKLIEPEQEPEEKESTKTRTGYTETQEILSTVLAYLDDIQDLSCKDCIYDNSENCKGNDCIIQNWTKYPKMIEIFKKMGAQEEH